MHCIERAGLEYLAKTNRVTGENSCKKVDNLDVQRVQRSKKDVSRRIEKFYFKIDGS